MNCNKLNQQAPVSWLEYVREITDLKSGKFFATDEFDKPVVLEWERIHGQTERLAEKINALSEILIAAYAEVEVEFAHKLPDAISNDFMLKSLAPLFKSGAEKVDWLIVEEKTKEILQQFFSTTDWKKYSGADDINIFVVAKDKEIGTQLGAIQFLFTPAFDFGNVKVALFGIAPSEQNRGLEKLLIRLIFKLIPDIKRVFLHIRSTNEKALNLYQVLGFTKFAGKLTNWIDLEYLSERTDELQKTSER